MKIPPQLYEVLANETDRLLDRLNEALVLDFNDARNNGPARHPSPDVARATEDALDEYSRLLDMIHEARGLRYIGHRRNILNSGASLSHVYELAMPLVRKITHLLRRAEPLIT